MLIFVPFLPRYFLLVAIWLCKPKTNIFSKSFFAVVEKPVESVENLQLCRKTGYF